jgi:hypothetical protein
MPTSTIRDRCDQIRQRLHQLGEATQRNENDPEPVSFDDRLQRLRQKVSGYKERQEAERNRVYPEAVPFDEGWEKVIAEWTSAHPKHDPTGLPSCADGGLSRAASSARLSRDARDLGLWFSILRRWAEQEDTPETNPDISFLRLPSGSSTRSEGFKCITINRSDKPEQKTEEQRHQKWLASVRAGKTRQKEATLDRRKARQREREYEALITGGSVTISKSGRKTILSREARDARADNIVRYNQNRLADSQPATINLPHIKHRLRSSCEENVMEFGLDQLFPDLDMIYSETRPDRVSEIGCTWRGNLFPWERDIDVLVKDWQCDLFPDKGWDEFQLQTKGTGYWYVLLRRATKETGSVVGFNQPKSLERLFHILSTIGIRSLLNGIQATCRTDNFRPLLFCSSKSVHTWVKSKHTYSDVTELIDLFEREDIRFRRYFWKFFSTIFPREVAILRRAETGLRAELAAMGNPKLTAEQVAEGFAIYLSAAKSEDGYTDDRGILAARFRQLRLNAKIRQQVLDCLPSWFRATPITPAKPKRDKKGRFVG